MLEFHHCSTCGCATHMTEIGTNDADASPSTHGPDPTRTRLVQKNRGHDGVFWTKTDSPVLPSHDAPATDTK